MNIRQTHHRTGRTPAARALRFPVIALLALGAFVGCAPRQAIVESDPNAGAPTTGGGGDVLTTLRADLRELADAQESFRADRGYYAARTSDLVFTASPGVRVDVIQGDRAGWSAVASSTSSDAECGMYQGEVRSPRSYLTDSGVIGCR